MIVFKRPVVWEVKKPVNKTLVFFKNHMFCEIFIVFLGASLKGNLVSVLCRRFVSRSCVDHVSTYIHLKKNKFFAEMFFVCWIIDDNCQEFVVTCVDMCRRKL